uniref:Ground-like domain-containing protein n=1 Tax=Acrobeloides nanus TaxID=290746 RepID=A0A914BXQ0_9BILA
MLRLCFRNRHDRITSFVRNFLLIFIYGNFVESQNAYNFVPPPLRVPHSIENDLDGSVLINVGRGVAASARALHTRPAVPFDQFFQTISSKSHASSQNAYNFVPPPLRVPHSIENDLDGSVLINVGRGVAASARALHTRPAVPFNQFFQTISSKSHASQTIPGQPGTLPTNFNRTKQKNSKKAHLPVRVLPHKRLLDFADYDHQGFETSSSKLKKKFSSRHLEPFHEFDPFINGNLAGGNFPLSALPMNPKLRDDFLHDEKRRQKTPRAEPLPLPEPNSKESSSSRNIELNPFLNGKLADGDFRLGAFPKLKDDSLHERRRQKAPLAEPLPSPEPNSKESSMSEKIVDSNKRKAKAFASPTQDDDDYYEDEEKKEDQGTVEEAGVKLPDCYRTTGGFLCCNKILEELMYASNKHVEKKNLSKCNVHALVDSLQ